jgi:hypothetical protein
VLGSRQPLVRSALLQKDLHDNMRHDVRMLSDPIDFNVRQTIGLGSEKLATSDSRNRLGVNVVIVFHGRIHIGSAEPVLMS